MMYVTITNTEVILNMWIFEITVDRLQFERILYKHFASDIPEYIDVYVDEDNLQAFTVDLENMDDELRIDLVHDAILYHNLNYETNKIKI
mgnify:CR=1 FL=1